MALTDYYVDPSIAANSGTGTIGDPYGDLQYALDQSSHDATNGTRFNIKSGTAEVLAASLDFSTYGTSTFTAADPLVIQGYDSSAGDGGMGEIDTNGFSVISNAAMDYVIVINLDCHGSGSNDLFALDAGCSFINCDLHDCDGSVLDLDGNDYVIGCYIYDFAGTAIEGRAGGLIYGNWIESKASSAANGASGIFSDNGNKSIQNNVVWLRGTTPTGDGVLLGDRDFFVNNTIRVENSKSTGSGVSYENTTSGSFSLMNNVISGFAVGIKLDGTGKHLISRNQLFWDNTTDESYTQIVNNEGSSAAGGDPFADKATGDFRLVAGYRGGAYRAALQDGAIPNNYDQGAIQHADPTGGAGVARARIG